MAMTDESTHLAQDLSDVPFEELLNIREKLGTKVYRHTVLGQFAEPLERPTTGRRKRPTVPNRTDRSGPIETSSKRLDGKFNFGRVQNTDELVRQKKQMSREFRDPRFDPQCGQFRPDKFQQNYAFLADYKRQELLSLQKRLKRAKSNETRDKLKFLIRRLKNQLNAEEEKQSQQMTRQVLQTKVANPEANPGAGAAAAASKLFVNKSLLKRTRLVQQYQMLKQTGRLDKYMQRKRKKLAAKDRHGLPQPTDLFVQTERS